MKLIKVKSGTRGGLKVVRAFYWEPGTLTVSEVVTEGRIDLSSIPESIRERVAELLTYDAGN